ncbi:antibiotic biosynthesis monooxygenase family protein [Niallia nealsonii]|uniref:Antibiotic biosynthesis monooxygenase n=1 Tax=Niallia nealsonii TaxID=115979 RepID=A0A2N0Z7H5_9BACI|nr:antibiotic biosynthesis monooxygenase [Niallia nealsonii]PKG25460.1 antibiotic biosynthesis monooxygenase [Niallia nealsonii]
MNIYLTSGTYDFLYKKYEKKFRTETLLLMQKQNGEGVLMHETSKKTIFHSPRQYEAISSFGNLVNEGFATMNHIPVTDEYKPRFEYEINKILSLKTGDFQASRLLKPKSGDMYIIFCLWSSKSDYIKWRKNPINTPSPLVESPENSWNDSQHHLFYGKSYLTQLTIPTNDD